MGHIKKWKYKHVNMGYYHQKNQTQKHLKWFPWERALKWGDRGGQDKRIPVSIINSSEPLHFPPTINMYWRKKSLLATSKAKKKCTRKNIFQYFHPTKTECEHQEKYLIKYDVLITVLQTQEGNFLSPMIISSHKTVSMYLQKKYLISCFGEFFF